MAENVLSSPLFAGRYKFQTVGNDWDTGRSGYTHLVFDMKTERLGVLKRAELKSAKAVEGLKNEVAALLDLKGPNVPEIYDTGEVEHGSKNYFYLVMEFIEGIRIEKNLDSLTVAERGEIIAQFFGLLAKAHKLGIVNGDVDLKHLFWRRDKKKLVVIDWGNAVHNVDPKKNTEFVYDLARSAEIVYALVTRKGRPAATGSIALPNDSALFPGLSHLPREFRDLCKWAPRNPTIGIEAPYTAQELLNASKTWQKGIPYPPEKRSKVGWAFLFLIAIAAGVGIFIYQNPKWLALLYPETPTPVASVTSTFAATETITPSETQSPTITSTQKITLTDTPSSTPILAVSPTFTPPLAISPVPLTYTNILLESDKSDFSSKRCWNNESNLSGSLNSTEGITQREDKNWQFKIDKGRETSQFISTDFAPCLDISQVKAFSINAWVTRLELERTLSDSGGKIEDGKQFGIYVEDIAGHRREYTIWVDQNQKMHLRVREDNNVALDESVLIINGSNLRIQGAYPRLFALFPIQVFLEINNQGLDILYLKEGPPQKSVAVEALAPTNQMIMIDKAALPTMGTIKKIGLIGYGGETQVVIWPLVFFGE